MSSHAIMLALLPALFTTGDAMRPALLFDVLNASVIVRKLSMKIGHCVAKLFGNALLGFHVKE